MNSYRTIKDRLAAFDKLRGKLIEDENGCFNWQGSCNESGYGQIQIEKSPWLAHRLMYQLVYGYLPKFDRKSKTPTMVCHSCDNPRCCNPVHIYLGTAKDNARDMADRCRVKVGYWLDKSDPGRSKERYGTVYWEIRSEIRTLSEWADIFSVNKVTLDARLRAGWRRERLSDAPDRRDRYRSGQEEYRRYSGVQKALEAMTALSQERQAVAKQQA